MGATFCVFTALFADRVQRRANQGVVFMSRISVWAIGLAGVLAMAAPSHAAMLGEAAPAARSTLTQPVQFPFPNPLDFLIGGRQYCWYDDGWRGPGWYWCGYGYREGYGWGGGEEWGYGHGWREHRHERDWRDHGGGGGEDGGGGERHHEGGRPGGGGGERHHEGGHPGGGERHEGGGFPGGHPGGGGGGNHPGGGGGHPGGEHHNP
jgi:hypothetical protein